MKVTVSKLGQKSGRSLVEGKNNIYFKVYENLCQYSRADEGVKYVTFAEKKSSFSVFKIKK